MRLISSETILATGVDLLHVVARRREPNGDGLRNGRGHTAAFKARAFVVFTVIVTLDTITLFYDGVGPQ